MKRVFGAGILLVLACGGSGTTTNSGTTTDTSGTTDTPTGSDTSTIGATTSTPTSQGEDATSNDPEDSTSDAETTTTSPPGDALDACLAYCAHLTDCDSPLAEFCADDCPRSVATYGYPGPECLANYVVRLECLAAATCDDINDPGAEPCSAEYQAIESEACASDVCLAHADHVIECGIIDPSSRIPHALECTYAVSESLVYGQACLDASEALYTCVAAAPCADIESGDVCMDKETEQDTICGF